MCFCTCLSPAFHTGIELLLIDKEMVISLVPRASPSPVLDHFQYTNDMSRGSFRKIVERGQKLPVKKLGGGGIT